jgi:hypothetical protein
MIRTGEDPIVPIGKRPEWTLGDIGENGSPAPAPIHARQRHAVTISGLEHNIHRKCRVRGNSLIWSICAIDIKWQRRRINGDVRLR